MRKGSREKFRMLKRAGRPPQGIQLTVMVTFMMVSLILMLSTSLVLYQRFAMSYRDTTLQNTENALEQTQHTLEDYLVSMRQVSDAVCYNVVTELDVSDPSLSQELGLIYESSQDSLVSIALYNGSGSLLAAAPVASQKTDPNVTSQEWFQTAMAGIENVHFSTPHVQNLFDDGTKNYYWVISLSRAVEVQDGDETRMGVLLVDMNYSGISQIMDQINETTNGQYYYLCDSEGNLVYHPRKVQISEGIAKENTAFAAGCTDGVYQDTLLGEKRDIAVRSISYTGWKLVGVIPGRDYSSRIGNVQYFIILFVLVAFMLLLAVNRLVAGRISRPILQLDDSVKAYEAGEKPKIVSVGPAEVRHLGHSIQKSYEQIDVLMKQIVEEQNERRKSEFDALQSQINPHFLYNTLDSITWMVEGGRNEEAVYMISELARLLRISLSKGHTILSLEDEIQHARSYMNIQKVRYRDRFAVAYDIEPAILSCCTVKLILQPILENAIYYGVGEMDEDDGGKITVTGIRTGDDVEITVEDNGQGMTKEMAENVLKEDNVVHKHGSGVGRVNVNSRIQLIFGKRYGLSIESEPDVGTKVHIRFPAVLFTPENQKELEQGRIPQKEET